MAAIVTFHSFIALALAIFVSRFGLIEANNGGFSVDLIHRDSPKSPLHNPSLTHFQRVNNALQRSFSRVRHFKSYPSRSASTDVVPDRGEYVMIISVGTPPVKIHAIADTGSDLIWTQCRPCTHCFDQKTPLFSPNNSSSYKILPCNSKSCQSLQRPSCNPTKNNCQYTVMYGDRSYTRGDVATETVRLGPTILRNMVFGCGHDNGGTFNDGASGIVGLGGGSESLVSQMGSSIGGKFSYCLVAFPDTKTSKMNFGTTAVVAGSQVVSTPIIRKSPDTFYFLTLEGISVGDKRLDFYDSSASSNDSKLAEPGNIIIDSGTTLTILPQDFYTQLTSTLQDAITSQPIDDPQGILSLCYSDLNPDNVPKITAHFSGADLKLNPSNTFIRTSESSVCLAFAAAESLAIFGNLAQMNFLVGYDLQKKTVSFKPTDCSQH